MYIFLYYLYLYNTIMIEKMITLVTTIQKEYQKNTRNFLQNQKEYIQKIKNDNIELVKKYTHIFTMLEKEQLNNQKFERLLYMLQMALKVNSGNIDSKKADIKVGHILVDQIVKPHLDKKQTDKSKLYNKNR